MWVPALLLLLSFAQVETEIDPSALEWYLRGEELIGSSEAYSERQAEVFTQRFIRPECCILKVESCSGLHSLILLFPHPADGMPFKKNPAIIRKNQPRGTFE